MAAIDIRTTVRGSVPRISFDTIANEVLGKDYQLSLVICGDKLARRINIAYRKKTYSPNVLSFELTPQEGEIFLNIRKAEREAQQYGVPLKQRLALLYVHGLYHLKGFAHGEKMEKNEERTLRKFGLN